MEHPKNRRLERSIAVILLAVWACILPIVAAAEDDGPERFTANLMSTTAGASGTSAIDIRVDRWTTEEERATLVAAMGDSERWSLVNALRALDRVGTAQLRNRTSRNLHYSREYMDGDTRHVILATDRPISTQEAARNSRTLDNNISIIHLQLDADGNGEGTLYAGAELTLDPETGVLEVTHLGIQPIRMTRVRTRN